MTKISIIIPVYNVEKYLRECLNSIINQTYTNWEAICINDGSPDNSLEILKEYAQKDERFIIIDKENGGVSAARNDALKRVTGEYITLVDPDDYIDPNTFEIIIKAAQENSDAELICFGAKILDERNSTPEEYERLRSWYHCKLSGKYALSERIFANLPGVSWIKLFKTNIIKENNILFKPYKFNEDVLFNTEYLNYTNYIYFVKQDLYTYRFRYGSALDNYAPKKNILSSYPLLIEQFINLYNYFDEKGRLLIFNKVFFRAWKNRIIHGINPEFEDKSFYISYLKEFIAILNENYDWGEEVELMKKGRFDKILQLNMPKMNLGNKLISIKTYSVPEPLLEINFLGLKIKTHYQRFFAVKNSDEKHKMFNILGIKFKFNTKSSLDEKFKNFIQKIFFVKNQNFHKVVNICGLKLKFKQQVDPNEILNLLVNIQNNTHRKVNMGTARLIKIAQVHQKTFLPHKNSNQGKTVFVCGAGPTLNWFEKSKKDAKYLALNRSFLRDNITYDYAFTNDRAGLDDYWKEFIEYEREHCTKFIGDLPLGNEYQIPNQLVLEANALRYYTNIRLFNSEFTLDIDSEPIGNFNTVALQAMQFALYTNPKTIYLAGIDNTPFGHFVGKDFDDKSRCNKERTETVKVISSQFIKLKEFAQNAYPNTRIISINPVGLRGLFEDVYTRSYLEANPEIAAELGENVKIFEEDEV